MEFTTVTIYMSNLSLVEFYRIISKAQTLSEKELDKITNEDVIPNVWEFSFQMEGVLDTQVNVPLGTFIKFHRLYMRLLRERNKD